MNQRQAQELLVRMVRRGWSIPPESVKEVYGALVEIAEKCPDKRVRADAARLVEVADKALLKIVARKAKGQNNE